ncbi:hypothetical protein NPIL_634911, partial [Nephila pilipes]
DSGVGESTLLEAPVLGAPHARGRATDKSSEFFPLS